MDLGFTSDFTDFKKNKRNKGIRSHLVSERFLLSMIKVLSSNITILKRSLLNMRRFLNVIDRQYYSSDNTTEALLLTCDRLLETRFVCATPPDTATLILKVDTLLTDDYEETKNNLIIPTIQLAESELPIDELAFIDGSLDYNLKFHKVMVEKDDIADLTNEISTCSYTDFPKLFKKYRRMISDMNSFFQSTDINDKTNKIVHTTEPGFKDRLKNTWKSVKNPATALRTGIQMFNSSLGPRGGFQNGNFYIYYANVNSFKSAFLEHISRMLKRWNNDIIKELFKNSGKVPTILHISLENDENEDNERLFKMEVGRDIGTVKNEEELERVWECSQGDPNDNIIDISFLHDQSYSMSVEDIDKLIDTLDEEGYHVIALVVDYLEMIRPKQEDMLKDIREKYRGIAESLLNLAKNRFIPVITAHQLNRAGGAILANTKNQGGSNAIAAMTNEYIGESYAIEKAANYSAFIDIEQGYLLYKRNKSRFRRIGKEMFVHPIRDGIILDDDLDEPTPRSLERIPDGLGMTPIVQLEKQNKRGIYDIRKKKEESAPLNNELRIEKSDLDYEIPSVFKDWGLDIGNFESCVYEFDPIDEELEIVTIGSTEYCFIGE